jgi:hypothetical protein
VLGLEKSLGNISRCVTECHAERGEGHHFRPGGASQPMPTQLGTLDAIHLATARFSGRR